MDKSCEEPFETPGMTPEDEFLWGVYDKRYTRLVPRRRPGEDDQALWDRLGPEGWELWAELGKPEGEYDIRRTYLNTTPHPIRLADEVGTFEVPPSGLIVSATIVEEAAGELPGDIRLVRSVFKPEPLAEDRLRKLHQRFHRDTGGKFHLIVIGSIIAAQAYPGLVYGMKACAGHERVPPEQKLMRGDEFVTF